MDTVNDVVREFEGSFAEHGIGKLKPYLMTTWRGGAELRLMQQIKAALDPPGDHEPRQASPLRPGIGAGHAASFD